MLFAVAMTSSSSCCSSSTRDLVRRERHRPDDAVLVVVLLDGRGDDARDADAVAAHLGRLLLAVDVEEGHAHGLRVLRAEEEDVADLDAPVALEVAARRSAGRRRRARPGGSRRRPWA